MPIGKEIVRSAGILLATLLVLSTSVAGQPGAPRHLNKTIEKLEAGEVVFGTFASDKSPSGGAFYGGAPVDFVIYDTEHEPLDFVGFRTFLQFMLDRRQIVEKGVSRPKSPLSYGCRSTAGSAITGSSSKHSTSARSVSCSRTCPTQKKRDRS